ncbi:hypothetical protein [Pelomonas sp. KK5]|uniref:hypothetical protein n=1 Tax=Pelomonas sp. KK5 TaxID=1855730 RepID=UPI00097C96B2|nr:hypothetical protein [Pelomonas sp. KK5]
MADRPELLDYVAFFEVEPEWVHPDGWYCGARFRTQRGSDLVVATVAPDEAEFSVQWWQGEVSRTKFQSVMVCAWELECSPGRELLRVRFSDERLKFCVLHLKPHVSVEWAMTW